MDAVGAVARQPAVPIIEDAAQAIGSTLAGPARPGALGDVATSASTARRRSPPARAGCSSPTATTCSSGSPRSATTAAPPTDFKYFVTDELGYKYRMSSLQAAFGRAQLQRLDELLERKRQIFDWYEARLRDIAGLSLNPSVPGHARTPTGW